MIVSILFKEFKLPKFKITQSQTHTVFLNSSEEFDTTNRTKWEELRNNAQNFMDEDEFEELPDSPPKDVALWMKVYQYVDRGEFANSEEDWFSERKGTIEVKWQIVDLKGKVVLDF